MSTCKLQTFHTTFGAGADASQDCQRLFFGRDLEVAGAFSVYAPFSTAISTFFATFSFCELVLVPRCVLRCKHCCKTSDMLSCTDNDEAAVP